MYTEQEYKSTLYHHGIKGQKWGVRRYQYENGSLTPEGRIHYGVGDSRMSIRSGDYHGYTTKKVKNPVFSEHRRTSQEIKDNLKTEFNKTLLGNAIFYIVNPATLVFLGGRLISHGSAMHAVDKRDKDLKQYESNRANTAKYNKQKGVYEQLNKPPKVLNSEREAESIATEVNKINRGLQKNNIETANCVCCSNAYIMRRKGYETVAKSSEIGYFPRDYTNAFPKSKVNTFYKKYDKLEAQNKRVTTADINQSELLTGKNKPKEELAVVLNLSKNDREKIKSEFFDSINKSKNGSYGTVTVHFNGAPGAHVFNYEVIDGTIYAVDCQQPKKMVAPLDKYIDSFRNVGGLSSIGYSDVTNIEPDFNHIKEFLI